MAVAERSLRETPKSSLLERKRPTAAMVETSATCLLKFLSGRSGSSGFCGGSGEIAEELLLAGSAAASPSS